MPRFHITISSHSADAMIALVRRHKIDVSDHGVRHNSEVGFLVRAVATDEQINFLTGQGYVVVKRGPIALPGNPQ